MTRVLSFLSLLTFSTGRLLCGTDLEVKLLLDANVARPTVDAAMTQFQRIMLSAGIGTRWTITRLGEDVVNSATETSCAAGRLTILMVGADSGRPSRTELAYSTPLSSSGIRATVFQPAVTSVARAHGVEPAVVLAHVLAHEIGHLLQRSTQHSAHGLMAASWEGSGFDRMARLPLQFRLEQDPFDPKYVME
jgi:Zn-dependent protease with chaperone function